MPFARRIAMVTCLLTGPARADETLYDEFLPSPRPRRGGFAGNGILPLRIVTARCAFGSSGVEHARAHHRAPGAIALARRSGDKVAGYTSRRYYLLHPRFGFARHSGCDARSLCQPTWGGLQGSATARGL